MAVALLLGLGLLSIFPQLGYRLFSQFPVRWLPPIPQAGLLSEFWLGTQLGLLWTPCAGPVLGSILILAAVKHQVIASWQLLMIYGIGAGLPMLGLAYTSRYVSRSLKSLRVHSLLLQRVGGMTIMITAIAILLGWDVKIQLWLAPLFPTSPL
jgi:cytochrome c biogenesis protein CcdA